MAGEPPGEPEECLAAPELVVNETILPAEVVMSEVGDVIASSRRRELDELRNGRHDSAIEQEMTCNNRVGRCFH